MQHVRLRARLRQLGGQLLAHQGIKASARRGSACFQLAYNATYANQRDYNGNTTDYSLDYYGGDVAGTFDIWTAKVSYESLEGTGIRGFTTPLATTHAFQGWADAFVQPLGGNKGFVDGLEDLNFTLNAKPRFRWDYLFNIDILVRYHDFDQRTGATSAASGTPDQAALNPKLTAAIKYADFERKTAVPVGPPRPRQPDQGLVHLEYKL